VQLLKNGKTAKRSEGSSRAEKNRKELSQRLIFKSSRGEKNQDKKRTREKERAALFPARKRKTDAE